MICQECQDRSIPLSFAPLPHQESAEFTGGKSFWFGCSCNPGVLKPLALKLQLVHVGLLWTDRRVFALLIFHVYKA